MSDRFSFLEFEDDAPAESADARTGPAGPIARGIGIERLPDGTALAEVRLDRPQDTSNDEDDGVMTLSARAGRMNAPAVAVPTRLRVVELFGGRGAGADQFHYPTGLAVDRSGVLFVADSYNHRIQRITPSGGVAAIGGRGTGRAQFLSPQGVAVDVEDSFYVVEQGGSRVQKFTREGVLTLVFGKPGRAEGELNGPTGITVAPGGDIYLCDTGNSRVQRFDAEGRFLSVIGAPGLYGAGLSSPQAVAVDPGGNLYAADTGQSRLVRFDPVGRADRQIGGVIGNGRRTRDDSLPLPLYGPRALAIDPLGLLYVADGGEPDSLTGEMRGRVRCLLLSSGEVLATVERVGRSLGTLLRPGGLALTQSAAADGLLRGDLYVADTLNHRVLRFAWG